MEDANTNTNVDSYEELNRIISQLAASTENAEDFLALLYKSLPSLWANVDPALLLARLFHAHIHNQTQTQSQTESFVEPSTILSKELEQYDFLGDALFMSGLKNLLESKHLPLDDFKSELVRAQLFYLCRRMCLPISSKNLLKLHHHIQSPKTTPGQTCPYASRSHKSTPSIGQDDPCRPLLLHTHPKAGPLAIINTSRPVSDQFFTELLTLRIVLVCEPLDPETTLAVLASPVGNCPTIVLLDGALGEGSADLLYSLFSNSHPTFSCCSDCAALPVHAKITPKLSPLKGKFRLNAADLLAVGVCKGMLPRSQLIDILKAAPFLGYIYGTSTFNILVSYLEDSFEYAGPARVSIIEEQMEKVGECTQLQLLAEIRKNYSGMLISEDTAGL